MTHAEKVLDSPIRVVEAGTKSSLDLISWEAHLNHALDSLLKCWPGHWNQPVSTWVFSSLQNDVGCDEPALSVGAAASVAAGAVAEADVSSVEVAGVDSAAGAAAGSGAAGAGVGVSTTFGAGAALGWA